MMADAAVALRFSFSGKCVLSHIRCSVKCGVAHLALQCLQVQTLLFQFVLLLLDFLHQLIDASVLRQHQPLETERHIC